MGKKVKVKEQTMKNYLRKNWKPLSLVLILLLSLPWTLQLASQAWRILTGASYKPAAIVVDVSRGQGDLREIWHGVGQGFEKPEGADLRLDQVAPILARAGVKYVRIDHIYDGYETVSRADGRLVYNWTKLDAIVSDIVAAGATPYFSLSYMPSAISRGDILDLPTEWGEWGQVVAATVARYSRDYRGGLVNVIYEVWNEPDLFGGFKMYGDKNYTTMYTVAANAAAGVKGTRAFKIGGPATTGFYPAWVDGFYKKLDSQVRIDFFSWHRYSTDISQFVSDVNQARDMIAPQIARAQDLYISEWGVDPERGASYDSAWAAAHYLAVNRALLGTAVDMILPFEVMDGGFDDKQFHGGWGMVTNPRYGAIVKKPRFRALELLSKMTGERIAILGEGDYVTAVAARSEDNVIRILAVNYDERGKHSEMFPMTITGLSNFGSYEVTEEYLSGRRVVNTFVPDGGIVRRDISLGASDAVLLTVRAK